MIAAKGRICFLRIEGIFSWVILGLTYVLAGSEKTSASFYFAKRGDEVRFFSHLLAKIPLVIKGSPRRVLFFFLKSDLIPV